MRPTVPNDVYDRQSKIPPWAVWTIAAKRGRALTIDEVVKASGLSRSTVIRTCQRKDWGFDLGVAVMFCHGCGYEFGRTGPQMKRMKQFVDHGLYGLRHFQIREGCPSWKRGGLAMRMKCLARIVTNAQST